MMMKKPLSEVLVDRFPFFEAVFARCPWLVQFVNFSIVGVINLFLSYFIYTGCVYVGLHHQIANQISFWLTVLNGYLLNKCWTFQQKNSGRTREEAVRYFAVYGMNYVAGIFLLYLFVDVLRINTYLAPVIMMPVTVPTNFLLNRYWVFRGRKKSIAKTA